MHVSALKFSAALKVTVDGGTNRWLTWLKLNNCDHQKNMAPDLITGDMDSIAENIVNYFQLKNRRLQIIRTEDQNETDFTKALKEIAIKNQSESLDVSLHHPKSKFWGATQGVGFFFRFKQW